MHFQLDTYFVQAHNCNDANLLYIQLTIFLANEVLYPKNIAADDATVDAGEDAGVGVDAAAEADLNCK